MIGASRIRTQMLGMALLPALLIALFLLAFYLQTRIDELEESMRDRIHAVAENLASASEFTLYSGDVEYLRRIAVSTTLRRDEDFEYGVLRDADGRIVVAWGEHAASRIPYPDLPLQEGAVFDPAAQRLIYHQPVFLSSAGADAPLGSLANEGDPDSVPRVLGWVSLQYSRAALVAERDAIVRNSLLILITGLALSGLLAFRLSGQLSAHIHHLVEAVRRIGRGDLEVRAAAGLRGELGILEQGINHMAIALGQAQERMQDEIDAATRQLRESLKTVAAQESRYRELVEHANSIILKVDLHGRITFFNEFAEKLFGIPSRAILGQPLVGTLFDATQTERIAALLDDGTEMLLEPIPHTSGDDRRIYVSWSFRAQPQGGDEPAGLIGIGIDVTESQRTTRAISLLSQAGTHGSRVFEDIARALQIGLDCDLAGIVEVASTDAAPHLLALVGRQGAVGAEAPEALAAALQATLADGTFECAQGLASRAAELARQLPLAGESLYVEPIQTLDGRVTGCLCALGQRPWRPDPAGRSLQRLVARRLTLEIQRLRDESLLRIARDDALAATEAKSRFLANVSHEIRTPLNGIIGFSNLLLRQELQLRERDQVGLIQQSARSLLAIINDILDLSKIEAGKLRVGRERFALVECIEDLIEIFGIQAHQKGLELAHELDARLPLEMLGDRQRLTQILTNLLGNAVKFTERGSITLRARVLDGETGESLRLEVTDTGIGIDEAGQAQLFEAFSQLDTTASRHHSGSGLGLAICRQLVDLMGGGIGLESRRDEGSCFHVTLPLERVGEATLAQRAASLLAGKHVVLFEREANTRAASAALLGLMGARIEATGDDEELLRLATADADPCDLVVVAQPVAEDPGQLCAERLPALRAGYRGSILVLTCDATNPVDARFCSGCGEWCRPKPLLLRTVEQGFAHRVNGGTPVAATTLSLEGRTLLVTDDNEVNRKLIATLLEQYGAHVLQARDGQEAIDLAGQGCELIFMDLQMPGISGIEATRRIRRQLGDRCPPVIALTASAMEGERERSLASGLDDHLTKPLDERLLLEALQRWLPVTPPGEPATAARPDPGGDGKQAEATVHDVAAMRLLTGGREALGREMLRLFLDEVPQHREALERSWRSADLAQLKAVLHKLRGSAEYCALPRLSRAAASAEQALGSEGLGRAEILLGSVREELELAATAAAAQIGQAQA